MAQDTPNLIQGSITRALLTLAIPIVFANLLQTAYQLTDTFWVGRLGADAVAAVSLSFPVLFFLISLGIGLNHPLLIARCHWLFYCGTAGGVSRCIGIRTAPCHVLSAGVLSRAAVHVRLRDFSVADAWCR